MTPIPLGLKWRRAAIAFTATLLSLHTYGHNPKNIAPALASVNSSNPTDFGDVIDIAIPPAMSEFEFEWHCDVIGAQEMQRDAIRALFRQYIEDDSEMRAALCPPLWRESARIASTGKLYADPRVAADFAALMDRRHDAVERLVRRERQFFD